MEFTTQITQLLRQHPDVLANPSRAMMIEEGIRRREAIASANGALATWTPPESTGRSPKDTYIVRRNESEKEIDWDGVDIRPLLFERGTLSERDLYWIWHPETDRWALRLKQWKIVRYGRGEPQVDDWQLFNLEDDPRERNDISDRHPEIVSAMHRQFIVERSKDL